MISKPGALIILDVWPQKALNLPDLPNGIGPLQSYCGERNFWMQRREAEIGLRDRKSDRRPKEQKDTGENSHRKGLFWVGLEIWGLVGLDGGAGRDRTANPHPIVEPVSDIRVRNGIFRCRDGRVKTEFSSRGDRYGDEGGLEKPAFRGTNARVSGGVRSLQTTANPPPSRRTGL
jgi:hypothetical protein